MRYDGRNPYGAKGGYVRDSRYGDFYAMDDREPYDMYDARRYDARSRMDRERYDMAGRGDYNYYPVEAMGRFTGYYGGADRYPRDGHSMLSEEDLKRWSRRLLDDVDDKDKQTLKMENIIKKAEQLSIRFDDYTPYEMYVTVLMMFTDYHKTLGTANYDVYIKLAKDWLCDDDSAVKYGKKLAAYYENIING